MSTITSLAPWASYTESRFANRQPRQRSSLIWKKVSGKLKKIGRRNTCHAIPRESKIENRSRQQDSHPLGRVVRLRAQCSGHNHERVTQDHALPPRPSTFEYSEEETLQQEPYHGPNSVASSHCHDTRSQAGGNVGCHSSTANSSNDIIRGDLTPSMDGAKALIVTVGSKQQASSRTRESTGPRASTITTSVGRQAGRLVTLRDVLMTNIVTSQTRRHRMTKVKNQGQHAKETSPPAAAGECERTLTPLQTREILKAMHTVASETRTPNPDTKEAILTEVNTCTICSQAKCRALTAGGDKTPTITHDSHTAYVADLTSQCCSLDTSTLQSIQAIVNDKGWRTDCCQSYICQSCLRPTIMRKIQDTWWRDISSEETSEQGWLVCPITTCNATMTRCSSTIRAMLRSINPEQGEKFLEVYATAEKLRSALRNMTPIHTQKEIRIGLVMYKRLVKLGCAWPLLGEQLASSEEDKGETPDFINNNERIEISVKRVTVDFPIRCNGKDSRGKHDDIGVTEQTDSRRVCLPLFTHRLRLPRLERDCVICAETYHDFSPNSIAIQINRADAGYETSQMGWAAAVQCFPGDWTQQICDFPPFSTVQDCNSGNKVSTDTEEQHEDQQEICRACLATHIETQLTILGPRVAEHGISLPTPCLRTDCHADHRFSFNQIHSLASPETFARYDRLVTLAAVCHEDGFRWCLRPGCESGAVYYGIGNEEKPLPELPELPTSSTRGGSGLTYLQRSDFETITTSHLPPLAPPPRASSTTHHYHRRHHRTASQPRPRTRLTDNTISSSRISCHTCAFEMCYHCQTPWHPSLTCIQAATQRTHGDPQPVRTQEWLEKYTKRCPGEKCGILVQKGEGCFHMTCSSCSAEFCWECLADWRGIVVDGRFRRDGHKDGCYFKGDNSVPPTQIMGRNLERGLRRWR